MMRVAVRIFHPGMPPGDGGPLTAWLHRARSGLAERHRSGFQAAGATDVAIVSGSGERPFGRRLRDLLPELGAADGLVILGSGAVPLASPADRRRLVAAARTAGTAIANNRYSADIVAIGGIGPLARLPDLTTDNALPRWLAEQAGYRVDDLRRRWRLGIDLDDPLDVILAGPDRAGRQLVPAGIDLTAVLDRLEGVARVAASPRAELVVAGRTSSLTLTWLERFAACRVRALVEERGLRAGTNDGRLPASALGALLDHEGPAALGAVLARLGEAAVIDTRVLLAHRLGRDEAAWPVAEDRFASDLLLPDRIEDPWLRSVTAAALDAPIPVLLGGHTLVGPGLRLVLHRRRNGRP